MLALNVLDGRLVRLFPYDTACFQCPNCSAISRSGTIDKQVINDPRHSMWPVTYEKCCRESHVPLEQMILHDAVTGRVLLLVDEKAQTPTVKAVDTAPRTWRTLPWLLNNSATPFCQFYLLPSYTDVVTPRAEASYLRGGRWFHGRKEAGCRV